jgi:hypothetical protein
MLIKWITCKVKSNNKSAFSIAQLQWSALNKIPGFIHQLGGWDLEDNSCACILAFWKDQESYTYFMDNIHDEIFESNKQVKTYDSISISLFSCLEPNQVYLNQHEIIKNRGTVVVVNQMDKMSAEKIIEPLMGNLILMGKSLTSDSLFLITTESDENGIVSNKEFKQAITRKNKFLINSDWTVVSCR